MRALGAHSPTSLPGGFHSEAHEMLTGDPYPRGHESIPEWSTGPQTLRRVLVDRTFIGMACRAPPTGPTSCGSMGYGSRQVALRRRTPSFTGRPWASPRVVRYLNEVLSTYVWRQGSAVNSANYPSLRWRLGVSPECCLPGRAGPRLCGARVRGFGQGRPSLHGLSGCLLPLAARRRRASARRDRGTQPGSDCSHSGTEFARWRDSGEMCRPRGGYSRGRRGRLSGTSSPHGQFRRGLLSSVSS